MYRGTTPTNTFTCAVDLSDADAVFVTYQQDGKTVLEKEKADLTFTEDGFSVKLTQEETLTFNHGKAVSIQIRAKYPDGSAIASNTIRTDVHAILKDGVI